MSEVKSRFVRVQEMNHDEKVEMYMKLPKKQLIEMLIECNNLLVAGNVIQMKHNSEHK